MKGLHSPISDELILINDPGDCQGYQASEACQGKEAVVTPLFRIVFTVAALVFASNFAAQAQDDKPGVAEVLEAWLQSPHANRSSEAFTHWNDDGEIPGTCAVCHSSTGVNDYLDMPTQTPGIIEHPVGLGTTVDCVACHTAAATQLDAVPFPSGAVVDGLGPSAICSVCHQGRASTETVLNATTGIEEDAVISDLRFINVHYAPSASTQLGSVVRVGFEYEGKVYKGRFDHVPDLDTCTSCHNPHTLQVEIANCTTCHAGAANFTDIRLTPTDFDGDGDTTEGIAAPIAEFHERLSDAIQRYATEIVGESVVYASSAYPYFFIDSDGDGSVSEAEAAYPNRYKSWTARLLKAAYNYQLVAKEPAIYTHNPHYALQLLYDSLESLSTQVDVDMAGLVRP